MQSLPGGDERWQLYRLLSDPTRLRVLALAAEEELSVGELSDLLAEPQPNVSRHAGPLRQAGLLTDRRQGTRTLVRLSDAAAADPVIADALATGRRLCDEDGSLARVSDVVARRDVKSRELFARPGSVEIALSPELPSYLFALATLIEPRELAIDAGTGDGVLLDLLAPIFRRVIAIDRSQAQLARARERVAAHGYSNVELLEAPIGGEGVTGADLVVAARVLHHAPRPRTAMQELARMARVGGKLLVIDYARHEDERFVEQHADVWMGFAPSELLAHARAAGLDDARVCELPKSFARTGPDAHLPWQCLIGTRREKPTRSRNGKQDQS
jgi:DNA-binding transcriptional ArsR family regulator